MMDVYDAESGEMEESFADLFERSLKELVPQRRQRHHRPGQRRFGGGRCRREIGRVDTDP
jgi:hypothetical protein